MKIHQSKIRTQKEPQMKSPETTPTPTPWTYTGAMNSDIITIHADKPYGLQDAPVATVKLPHPGACEPEDRSEAGLNAELIVRAVNAHDELVAVLREEVGRYPEGSGRHAELIALLAKAEGRAS